MKYTNSADGIKRVSVTITLRFRSEEIEAIKKRLEELGEKPTDKAVREYIAGRVCEDNVMIGVDRG